MISILKQSGKDQYGICEFVVDTTEELKKLPMCAHGSTSLVIAENQVYILDGNKKWNKLLIGKNGSGSSTIDKQTIIDQVNEYLATLETPVDVPQATQNRLGLVKGSAEVGVDEEGALIINKISIEKIEVPDGMRLILDSQDSDY